MHVDRQGPHFRGQCTWLKAQCFVGMSFFSLWFCYFKGLFKLEIWLWRKTLTWWMSVSQAMHFVVWNAELRKQTKKVSGESCVMSLSLLDTALWKARRYIQFDLRFGSADNCAGTYLFITHKSCLAQRNSNFFLTGKKKLVFTSFKSFTRWTPHVLSLFLSGAGTVEIWPHGFHGIKRVQGLQMPGKAASHNGQQGKDWLSPKLLILDKERKMFSVTTR